MTLDRYVALRYLKAWFLVLAGFFALTTLIGLVEQVDRFSDDANGFGAVVALALLDAPGVLYPILPLVTAVAAIVLFLGLARSSELAVTRAAGRSALRLLLGPGCVTVVLGVLAVAALNPIVAATTREYDARVGRLDGQTSALAVGEDGLWLGQAGAEGPTIIRAARTNPDGTELRGVTFLTYDAEGRAGRRIEAATARLDEGGWTLTEAKAWPLLHPNPEAAATFEATAFVPSTLTPDQIRDSFGSPASVPIWELPRFIGRLEAAGFAAQRHRVFLHMELAQPAFLLAMVLVAAAFTMRHQRGRRTGLVVLAAILTGFVAYVVRNVAQVIGEAGQVPPALAAWAPPLAAIACALGLLLHLEEG